MDQSSSPSNSSYWSGGHTKHRLLFHLVFTPKYRARVLEEEIARRLRELLLQACEVNSWQIHELGIQPDHLHLLLQISPRESISDVVQRLKGGTSRVLRLEYPELEEFLWGKSFWGEGYFVESVGEREESVIRRYIAKQREPTNPDFDEEQP